MRQKLYGVFQNIDDAKEALGRIKKESLNLVDLTVLYLDPHHHHTKKESEDQEFNLEMATEDFIDDNRLENVNWPGLRNQEIEGLGKVLIGISHSQTDAVNTEVDRKDFEPVEPEIINHKIVAKIEIEPQIAGKIRYILESIGAEVIEE